MLDGDPGTFWMTSEPQKPADRIDIALPGPEVLTGVRLHMGSSINEYPRNLEILVSEERTGRSALRSPAARCPLLVRRSGGTLSAR